MALEPVLHDDAWRLPSIEPTNLIAAWGCAEPPPADGVVAAIGVGRDRLRVIDEPASEGPMCWCRVLEVDPACAPVVLWAEPAQGEDGGPDDGSPAWVVGVETLLASDDPIGSMVGLMRLLLDGCPGAKAVLDVNTSSWYRRDQLLAILGEELDAPADLLWVVHAVRDAAGAAPGWLHTHGLWRCGRPELEMLEVPAEQMPAAVDLINGVAELLLECDAPPPGAPFEIGPDLRLTLQPWREAARFVGQDAPGSISRRDEGHGGVRAALCAERPAGAYREVWQWPSAIVERLASDETAVYRTTRATRRQFRMAQTTWHMLLELEASGARETGNLAILFKSPVREAGEGGSREHLWFDLQGVDEDRVTGELINEPVEDCGMHRGAVVTVNAGAITDWRVLAATGSFGPADALATSEGHARWDELRRTLAPEEPEPAP